MGHKSLKKLASVLSRSDPRIRTARFECCFCFWCEAKHEATQGGTSHKSFEDSLCWEQLAMTFKTFVVCFTSPAQHEAAHDGAPVCVSCREVTSITPPQRQQLKQGLNGMSKHRRSQTCRDGVPRKEHKATSAKSTRPPRMGSGTELSYAQVETWQQERDLGQPKQERQDFGNKC